MDGEGIAGALLALLFLFVVWVIATIASSIAAAKNREGGFVAVLIGFSFPILALGYYGYDKFEKYRIVRPGEPYRYSYDKVFKKWEAGYPLFDSLCKKFSINENKGGVVTGFRLQGVKPLKDSNAQARGWNSAIDFYAGAYKKNGHYVYSSIEENLQVTLPRHMVEGIFEFQDKDGRWKRLVFDKNGQSVEPAVPTDIRASHGIVVEQEFTGYEKSFTIFQVSISVYELASNRLIARNVGLFHDGLWGEHNNYQLVPHNADECRCRDNDQSKPEEYVAHWLSSISKN